MLSKSPGIIGIRTGSRPKTAQIPMDTWTFVPGNGIRAMAAAAATVLLTLKTFAHRMPEFLEAYTSGTHSVSNANNLYTGPIAHPHPSFQLLW